MTIELRWWLSRQRERLQLAIAWHLPRWLVYWATLRCFAHGTTGRWGNTEPDTLTYGTLMKRWETRWAETEPAPANGGPER